MGSIDLRPDVVIMVGPRHSPLHAIVVEIQQKEEPGKLQALPRYAAALWLQLACPITVLMVCPKARTAKWAAAPIRTSLPGYTLTCRVIGPDQIPAVTDPAEAAAHPELAALPVMAHGEHPPVMEAFVAALRRLPDEYAPHRAFIRACTDVGLLDEWVRRAATATSAADLFAEES